MVWWLLRDFVFAKKFEYDNRVPRAIIQVPCYLDTGGGQQCRFGWIVADYMFAVQLFGITFLQSIVNVALAWIIYNYIVLFPQQQEQGKKFHENAEWTRSLVAYGICSMLIILPFGWIHALDLRNQAIMFGPAINCCLMIFRCLEAFFDTVPAYAKSSQLDFILYYASTVQFRFDPQTNQVVRVASAWDVLRKAVKYGLLALQAIILFSLLNPRNYQLFLLQEDNEDQETQGLLKYWTVRILNNLAMAILTSICLEAGGTGVGVGMSALTGYMTVDIHDNPLSQSCSPSEFWNRRWNTVISHALKRAIYLPLVQQSSSSSPLWMSKPMAALATFCASGIMHEYIILVITYLDWKDDWGHIALSGTHFIFFAWNGVVLMLEQLVKNTAFIRWFSQTLPRPIKTALVVLTVLPLAHLFTDVYVTSGFYTSIGLGLPRIEYYGCDADVDVVLAGNQTMSSA